MATSSTSGSSKAAPLDIAKAIPDLQRLVDECNTFKCDGALPGDHGYLALPDKEGALKIFGILQPQALETIDWPRHGFAVVSLAAARKPVGIPEGITNGQVVMPNGLSPDQISAKFEEIALNQAYYGALRALADWDKKEYVPLVEGHPKVYFPDKVGVYLGVLQVGVHLTIYMKMNGPERLSIFVQTRSPTASSYPGMLDQTAAGGLKFGETMREGICREAEEEVGDNIVDLVKDPEATIQNGNVVFSTVRPQQGKNLAGSLEISTKVCFSLEVKNQDKLPEPQGKDSQVKGFTWMTADEVVVALKDGRFKPNSALVMIKFLIDQGVLGQDVEGVKKLRESLQSKVPLTIPENI